MTSPQPLITVKKSDGSSVKMTLREFEAYQKKRMGIAPPKAPSPSASAPGPSAPPRPPLPKAGAPARPPRAVLPDELANEVIKVSGVRVPAELASRARSLVISRVKDVRTDDQFLSTAMAPSDRGGLALYLPDAEKLLRAVTAILPTPERKMPKPKVFAVPTAPKAEVSPPPLPTPPLAARGGGEERPVVRDVVLPPVAVSESVGPVDELGRFTLADFRRLGATPDAAASRIREKFESLKSESYLLFMQARDAWRRSPVVMAAMNAVAEALRQKVRLADLLAATPGKERMTMEVFSAVIQINKSIRV